MLWTGITDEQVRTSWCFQVDVVGAEGQAFTFLASEKDYPLDYPDVNILMLLHKKRFKIAEAPVRMVNNQQGDSMHSGLRPVMYVIRMFLAIALVLLRKED